MVVTVGVAGGGVAAVGAVVGLHGAAGPGVPGLSVGPDDDVWAPLELAAVELDVADAAWEAEGAVLGSSEAPTAKDWVPVSSEGASVVLLDGPGSCLASPDSLADACKSLLDATECLLVVVRLGAALELVEELTIVSPVRPSKVATILTLPEDAELVVDESSLSESLELDEVRGSGLFFSSHVDLRITSKPWARFFRRLRVDLESFFLLVGGRGDIRGRGHVRDLVLVDRDSVDRLLLPLDFGRSRDVGIGGRFR